MYGKARSTSLNAPAFGDEHRTEHTASPPGYRLGVAIAAGTLLVFLLRYFGTS